ncbi:hypothetical protein K3725_11545 [Leisingera sp. S132]|uniref:hypothetical protein n=1 Tax=Leisingera sp. S132 TaxID=2867016 RepID=UPI0021A800FA|nr:hypothetical protein [Leisingera sp. S132]UWQ77951.1 hypothetical protein K3725_11545 [Leisingera sp. S132]
MFDKVNNVYLRVVDDESYKYKFSSIFKFFPIIVAMFTLCPYVISIYLYSSEFSQMERLWTAPVVIFNFVFFVYWFAFVVSFYFFFFLNRCEALIISLFSVSSPIHYLVALGISAAVIQSVTFTAITMISILFTVSNFKRANDAVDHSMVKNFASHAIRLEYGNNVYVHGGVGQDDYIPLGRLAGGGRYFVELIFALPLILGMILVWPFVFVIDDLQEHVPISTLFWAAHVIIGLMTRGPVLNQAWLLVRVLRLVRSGAWEKPGQQPKRV